MTDIIQSIIQKVKDELSIVGDYSSTDLYDQLFEYRSNLHPDKFLDETQKAEAEEKFKKINSLLQELERFIKEEKIQKKPSEIIPFKESYEIVTIKQTNIQLEEKIASLQNTLSVRDYELRELKRELKLLRVDKIDQKTQELIKHYKPTKKSLFSLGLTFFLTLLFGVLSKVDEIATLITKYSPLNENLLKQIFFVILIAIPLIYAKLIFEEKDIETIAKKIRTPLFINGFVKFLETNNLEKDFTELTVYNYLTERLISKSILKRFFYSKVLTIYTEATNDNLKDIFIYNLLTKKLIYISSPKMLDRTFKIWNHQHYYPGQDDDEI